MMKLKGKIAFITGFGSGLGQAVAVMFAKEGATVAGTSPTESKGRETVAMVEKLGGKALYWPGDVSNSTQMKTVIAETVRQLGGIDIVVNSGGIWSKTVRAAGQSLGWFGIKQERVSSHRKPSSLNDLGIPAELAYSYLRRLS